MDETLKALKSWQAVKRLSKYDRVRTWDLHPFRKTFVARLLTTPNPNAGGTVKMLEFTAQSGSFCARAANSRGRRRRNKYPFADILSSL
jgi:hypothetical protein